MAKNSHAKIRELEIFDSTLRDGAQGEGVSFSVSDKLNIIRTLDEFGVRYIEAGNPASNPKDMEFFEKVKGITLKNSTLCAFGSTCRKGVSPAEDKNVLSVLGAETPAVAIFGKSWDFHVHKILNATLEENLEIVHNTLRFFKQHGKEVIFDAEHFFDGCKANEDYALSVLDAAVSAGADVLCLCDTNGGCVPSEIFELTQKVTSRFPDVRVGIHCHNDSGCAVANSIAATEAGACHIQGTFTGIGERCGNTDLSVFMPTMQLKRGYRCIEGGLETLTDTAIRLSEIANQRLMPNKPYTGASAFAHKGGMHIDGVAKNSSSFEHVQPESVGNRRRFLMSEVSGRTTVLAKMAYLAADLDKNSPETAEIIARLKALEHEGYQFEAADASLELLVLNVLGKYKPHFKLGMYKTSGESPASDGEAGAYAVLKIEVDGKTETTASVGNGPVNALDTALRKALTVFYPQLKDVHLTDYKVRVLSAQDATAAKVRVLMDSSDGKSVWTTVGVSTDIIEASWKALVDSLEYILYKKEAVKEVSNA